MLHLGQFHASSPPGTAHVPHNKVSSSKPKPKPKPETNKQKGMESIEIVCVREDTVRYRAQGKGCCLRDQQPGTADQKGAAPMPFQSAMPIVSLS